MTKGALVESICLHAFVVLAECLRPVVSWLPVLAVTQGLQIRAECQQHMRLPAAADHHECQTKQSSFGSVAVRGIKGFNGCQFIT